MGSPEEIPPNIPPCRFDPVPIGGALLASGTKMSLFSLPRLVTQPNPIPYSTPSTAGRLNSALARSALSLSNTGSPSPAGIASCHDFRRAANGITLLAQRLSIRFDHFFSRSRNPDSGRYSLRHRRDAFSTASIVTAAGSAIVCADVTDLRHITHEPGLRMHRQSTSSQRHPQQRERSFPERSTVLLRGSLEIRTLASNVKSAWPGRYFVTQCLL